MGGIAHDQNTSTGSCMCQPEKHGMSHPLLTSQMQRLQGEIINGFPTLNRKGEAVLPTHHIRERLAAALYWSRLHFETLGPEHAYGFFLYNNAQFTRGLEEEADRLLSACDCLGIQLVDEQRED